MSAEREDRITYAFGHLVSSFSLTAHAGDSGDLARDVLQELGMSDGEIETLIVVAEDVANNYAYTGEADEFIRRIRAGEA